MSNQYEIPILEALHEDGGFTAGHIAASFPSPLNHKGRAHTYDVRKYLFHMREKGWVRPMDDQLPICWVRTPSGTKALKRAK